MRRSGATEMAGIAKEPSRGIAYLDANPLIYLIEGGPELAELLTPLFAKLRAVPGAAVTSELTLAEVLAPTARGGRIPAHLRRAYLNLLVWGRFISLEPVTRPVLYETVELRLVRKLKLPDAIHLATAIRTGCHFLMTKDAGIPLPRGMSRVAPDQANIARILKALA